MNEKQMSEILLFFVCFNKEIQNTVYFSHYFHCVNGAKVPKKLKNYYCNKKEAQNSKIVESTLLKCTYLLVDMTLNVDFHSLVLISVVTHCLDDAKNYLIREWREEIMRKEHAYPIKYVF